VFRAGPPQAIRIPPGKQRLEIQYTSLNLAAPERARFKYRLEGLESRWTEVGDARVARYSSLPPGDYRFRVTACNEDGLWHEAGSTLAITVDPPFWRTWWFVTTTTFVSLGLVVGGVHYLSTQKLQHQLEQLKQQEVLEKERARIARDLHDQLGANLTQVSLLGELVEADKDAPQEVESLGQQIARTARDTTRALDEIVWAADPSNDTLEGLVNYICKYAQEYLAIAGLRYRLDVPAQLPPVPVPPEVRHNVFLASKEAVTNIVRHAKASAAWVRLKVQPGRFTLEIEDNGRGMSSPDEKTARNGLRNMRKRMEDIGGEFSIGTSSEGGALIRLTAPIKTH
jgi:signal transduction histidine kinase